MGQKKKEKETSEIILRYNKENTRIYEITPILKSLISENGLDVSENNIVLLTENNAKKIENEIEKDDNYFPFAKRIYDSFDRESVIKNENRALLAVIREIDRDNSTNVWRYGNREGIYKIVDYILDPENYFFEKLEQGEISLPDELNKVHNGIFSLSSKVCKYLSDFLYGKDNYYINDRYIRYALLFYLDYYGIEKERQDGTPINSSSALNNLPYKELFCLLEKLRRKAIEKHKYNPSRNELDHIIWYCYKSFKVE